MKKFLAVLLVLGACLPVFADEPQPQPEPGQDWSKAGLSLRQLGFWFTGRGCFVQVTFPNLPKHISEVVAKGGILVQTTRGIRIMTPFDPATLDEKLERFLSNDMILATPIGYRIYPRYQTGGLPNDWVETFQRPVEAGPCEFP